MPRADPRHAQGGGLRAARAAKIVQNKELALACATAADAMAVMCYRGTQRQVDAQRGISYHRTAQQHALRTAYENVELRRIAKNGAQ